VALNWAVAKCEGIETMPDRAYPYINVTGIVMDNGGYYKPSTEWAYGGPIIEREGIELWCSLLGQSNHADPMWQKSHWRAKYYNKGVGDNVVFDGTTPLEAAMRCYVASKLGIEIDIPQELV